MDKIISYLNDILPNVDGDTFFSLLIFLLMVFGGLYVLFQIIFYLGDDKRREKKKAIAEKKAEVKETSNKEPPKEKEKTVKEKIVVHKEPKVKKVKVKKVAEAEELVFLEEEKPVENPNGYFRHDNTNSYIVGNYTQGNTYSYGENYLHEYYNNGKTVNDIHIIEPKEEKVENIEAGLEKKSDSIIKEYNDLPSELKRYILYKMFTSTFK